jgi:hypothetical protein
MPFMSQATQQQLENIKLELQQIAVKPIDNVYTVDERTKEIKRKSIEYTQTLQNAVLDMLDT